MDQDAPPARHMALPSEQDRAQPVSPSPHSPRHKTDRPRAAEPPACPSSDAAVTRVPVAAGGWSGRWNLAPRPSPGPSEHGISPPPMPGPEAPELRSMVNIIEYKDPNDLFRWILANRRSGPDTCSTFISHLVHCPVPTELCLENRYL